MMYHDDKRAVVRALRGAFSLLQGMGITFSYIFHKPITIQYPEKRADIPLRFRGRLALPVDPEKGIDRCTACKICAKACPNHSIEIVKEAKPEGSGPVKPRPASFMYNMGSCMFCNLCVEACPFFALVMADDYEMAATGKDGFIMDLVAEKRVLVGKKAPWWQSKFRTEGEA